jgi:hypothetical protein
MTNERERRERRRERRVPRARTKERVVSAIASSTRGERRVGKKGGGRKTGGTAGRGALLVSASLRSGEDARLKDGGATKTRRDDARSRGEYKSADQSKFSCVEDSQKRERERERERKKRRRRRGSSFVSLIRASRSPLLLPKSTASTAPVAGLVLSRKHALPRNALAHAFSFPLFLFLSLNWTLLDCCLLFKYTYTYKICNATIYTCASIHIYSRCPVLTASSLMNKWIKLNKNVLAFASNAEVSLVAQTPSVDLRIFVN